MTKPQPYYARFTQPPRSPNGRNRRSATQNHSDPLDGAGAGTGGAKARVTKFPNQSFYAIGPSGLLPFPSPPTSAIDWAKLMADMKADIDAYTQMVIYGFSQNVEPPPIPYTGIVSGELTGHRAWLVTDKLELCSLAHYFVWEPGKTIEGDINKVVATNHVTGKQRYGGVYAYRDWENLRDDELVDVAKEKVTFPQTHRLLTKARASAMQPWMVTEPTIVTYETVTYLGLAFGTVKLWGEVVEHEKGYRASFAKLTGIDGFIGVRGFEVERLREKYLSSDGE